ncbi:Uncharacterised protein [Streptococcus pneumoniae]|nr:Uncharacterised protein [Streptococcus pneumoniae]
MVFRFGVNNWGLKIIRKIAVMIMTVIAPPSRVATWANGIKFIRFAVLRMATSPVPPMPL